MLRLIFIFTLIFVACAMSEHRREALQIEHPDCEVTEYLEIRNCKLPIFENDTEPVKKEVKREHKRNSK